MPSLCEYKMCHNLASSSYQGYCNEDHKKKANQQEYFLKILKENPNLSTIRDVKKFLKQEESTSFSHCFPN
jgi:hypothetical protein